MNNTTEQSHPSHPLMRIFTFGEFAIERLISSPAGPIYPPRYARLPWEEWSNRRAAMKLLKILLCAPNRRVPKDELIQSIWPNHAMINALHTLDSAASILRRHILQTHSEESLLQTIRGNGDTALKLAAQSSIWIDADAFLTLAACAIRAEKQKLDPLPLLESAHALVQGQFLEDDPHADWSQRRRNTINGARHRVFYKLVELYLRDQRISEAEELLFSFLEQDPTDEDALCHLMIILAERERRQEALAMYAYVTDELGEKKGEPTPYTQELVRRIRHGLAVRERSIDYLTTPVNATAFSIQVTSTPCLSGRGFPSKRSGFPASLGVALASRSGSHTSSTGLTFPELQGSCQSVDGSRAWFSLLTKSTYDVSMLTDGLKTGKVCRRKVLLCPSSTK